ncbi:MAG: hypothetical protein ABI383_04285 [Acidobacteriaceae bacterium]
MVMGKRQWGWLPGAAVGLLLGISAGLSSVPVIAAIIAALTAGLLVLLGVKNAKDAPQPNDDSYDRSGVGVRVAGFALVCTLALIAGVAIRAHDWLAPSPLKMQQKWTSAGFSDADAHAIVLYQKLGLMYPRSPAASTDAAAAPLVEAKDSKGAGAGSSLLFAGGQTECAFLNRSQYRSTDAMLESMSLQDAKLQSLAKTVAALPSEQRDPFLKSIFGFVCG